jgi:hypothetical protein
MRLRKTGWVVATALVLVGGFGVAGAQPAEAPPPAAPPAETGAQRDVALTPEQMLAEAERNLPEMERAATVVRRQLEQAREARDVVKVLCLNDKLNQIDVATRSGRDRLTSIRSAAGRKDADRTKREYTVIQVLRDRVRALLAEANQCIGEETGFVGDSRVTVEIDPSIPEEDPSAPPKDPLISIPPVIGSPTG